MNEKIFKAYDVRGVFPEEINEETAYKIGKAFVCFLKNKSSEPNSSKLKIVVGMDNRLSSGYLFAALEKGILEQGGEIIDIGFCTTPMFYYGVAKFNYDGGIMITASHNPPQYNGFKMVNKGGVPISESTGLIQIKELALADNFILAPVPGRKEKKDILPDYWEDNFIDEDFSFTIVVDTANSVSSIPIKKMLKNTALIHIFDELDGKFPNHEPNPARPENLRDLCSAVKAARADLGVAFDGDGDRIFFVDEKGETIKPDLITALLASIILKKNFKQTILYDISSGNIVPETIKKWGSQAIMTRVGHSLIKEKMRQENAIFGGEFSGHYFFKKSFFSEEPFTVLFLVLGEMKKSGNSLSEIIEPFRKYFHSEELNYKVEDAKEKIKQIKEKYQSGNINEMDGLRVDFEDWWFLVRPSNTEPVLRLMVEAKTKFMLEHKIKELEEVIKNN
ncbi:MAG: phosphomannomutase/phosphoglucomutase [Candidatus Paceibacterota bacterium]